MIIICPNCREETEEKHGLCTSCGEEIKHGEKSVELDSFDDPDEEDILLDEIEEVND